MIEKWSGNTTKLLRYETQISEIGAWKVDGDYSKKELIRHRVCRHGGPYAAGSIDNQHGRSPMVRTWKWRVTADAQLFERSKRIFSHTNSKPHSI